MAKKAMAAKPSDAGAHKTIKRSKKMTDGDISLIVAELKHWEDKERGTHLTWETVEKFSGFTKPALRAKPQIVDAFARAKEALANPGRKPATRKTAEQLVHFEERNRELLNEIDTWKKREQDWLARWERIAYHAHARGLSIEELDRPLPSANRT